MTIISDNECFTLGNFTVNTGEFFVQGQDNEKINLPAKSVEVLCYLAAHYPRVITREELIEHIWQGNKPVGEKSLTNAVWSLRKSFSSDNQRSDYIATIRKGGYKLLVEPAFEQPEPIAVASELLAPEKLNSSRRFRSFLLLNMLFLAAAIGISMPLLALKTPPLVESVESLTEKPGREIYPSISPDGLYLAYIWLRLDHASELYLQDLQHPTTPARRLTSTTNRDVKPVWSKDSQTLYFIRKDQLQNTCNIMAMGVLSGELKPLTQCAQATLNHLSIDASGQHLYYTGEDSEGKNPGRYRINLTDNNGQGVLVSCDKDCQYKPGLIKFSPDGKRLIEERSYKNHLESLYLVNLSDGTETKLLDSIEQVRGISWHPDSRHIAYSSYSHGKRSGFVMDTKTQEVTPLELPGFSYPNFNPKGDKIYYHSWQQSGFISKLSLQENALSLFPVLQSRHSFLSPHYSAVADKLVYVSNESGSTELWMSNLQGNQRVQLTHLKQIARYPRWSPDGKYIAFLLTTGNNIDLRIIEASTGNMSKVPSPFKIHRRPTWHPQSQHIIAGVRDNGNNDLYLIDIDKGSVDKLTDDGGVYGELDRNNMLYYTTGNWDGLWKKDLKTGTTEQLIQSDLFTYNFHWTKHQGRLFFQQRMNKQYRVHQFDIKSQTLTTVLNAPLRTLDSWGSMAYVEKSNELLISMMEYPQVDVKIADINL